MELKVCNNPKNALPTSMLISLKKLIKLELEFLAIVNKTQIQFGYKLVYNQLTKCVTTQEMH